MWPRSAVVLLVTILVVVTLANARVFQTEEDYGDYARKARETGLTEKREGTGADTDAEPLPYLVPPAEGSPWELGFDAGDILVPPEVGLGSYSTLKLPPEDNSDIVVGENREVPRPPDQTPTSVYSFVKTDREGHFKWGVRYGKKP